VTDSTGRLIRDQIEYYQQRAREYDKTAGPEDSLREDTSRLVAALDELSPRGKVLELACGTGNWTRRLLLHDVAVTALDSSRAMLELNSRKVDNARVRYVLADLFAWEPDDVYDMVFFSFWLSHVPPARFERFWDLAARCLRRDGRVLFVDEARHDYWFEEFVDEREGVVLRRLADGSTHRAVKVLWVPEELEARLAELGWDVAVRRAGPFYWGTGRPMGGSSPSAR
jgi:ubiquinone/menaquinone biosynthesis C-methylase UbiE